MLLRAQAIADLPEQFALMTSTRQIQLAPWIDEVVDLAETNDNGLRDVRRLSVDAEFRELHWDPRRRGGLPVVGESNVLASTIADVVDSGEPVDEVASWYHLTPEQVDAAVRYSRMYAPAA